MSKEQNRFNPAEKVILVTGIILIVLAFISEFNFHYFQGFMPETIDLNIFWRAEFAEVFNSMSFLTLGIILIIISFKLSKKRRTTKPIEYNQ